MVDLPNPDLDWVYFVTGTPQADAGPFPIYWATRDVFFDAGDPTTPNREFNGIVDVALSVSRSIGLDQGLSADAQPNYGAITISFDDEFFFDADAGVPKLRALGWSWWPVTISRATPPDDGIWRSSALETVFNGIFMGGNIYSATDARLPIGGLAERLSRDLDLPVYGGTGGFDGGNDLAGKVKPIAVGLVREITPVLVDAANQWWDCCSAGFHTFIDAKQGGVAYVTDAGNPPAAGKIYVDAANGRIRTNGYPTFPITVSFRSAFGSNAVSAADCARELMIAYAGFGSGEFNAASITAVNGANAATVGYYIDAPIAADIVVNALLRSIGAAHTEYDGLFEMFVWSPPTAASPDDADLLLEDDDLSLGGLSVGEQRVPPWRLDFGYGRCWTPLDNDRIAGAASTAARAFLSQDVRIAPHEEPDTLAKHRGAGVLRIDSSLDDKTAAEAEAARQGAMFCVDQEFVDAPIGAAPFALKLGAEVWLDSPFNGINAAFRVAGVSEGAKSAGVTLTLWRPR